MAKKKPDSRPDLYQDDDDDLYEVENVSVVESPKKGLFAAVKSLWKRSVEEDVVIPSGPMEGEEDHWVALSLEQLLENDPDTLLHIISLRGFANALGPVWERMATKAMMIAESTVRLHSGSSAEVRQHGDDTFLVLFPHLTPENGRRKAFDVSVLLGKKLVGAKFQIVGGGGALGIGLVSLPGSMLLNDDGGLSDQVLDDAADAAPQVSDTAEAGVWLETEGKVQIDPTLIDGQGKLGPLVAEGWLKFKVKQKKTEIRLVPLEPPKRRKTPDPEWVPIRRDK